MSNSRSATSSNSNVSDNNNNQPSGEETGNLDCPICLSTLSDGQEIGKPESCTHIFCFKCISNWSSSGQRQSTCPMCRQRFNNLIMRRIGQSESRISPVRKSYSVLVSMPSRSTVIETIEFYGWE